MIKTKKKIKRVAFFGDATLGPKTEEHKLAKDTAKLLAENNFVIVNGGGPGIMGAATTGAREAGGRVELVIIDPSKEPNNYEGTDKDNLDYANKIYTTNNYQERLNKLVEIADAFVVFKGGTGTLSEAGLVWELAKFDYGHHEPIIFVGKEWKEIIELIEKKMNFEEKEKRVVTVVETAEEVVAELDSVTKDKLLKSNRR